MIIKSHSCENRRYSALKFTQVLFEMEYSSLLLQGDQWSRGVSELIPHHSKISVILVHSLHGMDTIILEMSLHTSYPTSIIPMVSFGRAVSFTPRYREREVNNGHMIVT